MRVKCCYEYLTMRVFQIIYLLLFIYLFLSCVVYPATKENGINVIFRPIKIICVSTKLYNDIPLMEEKFIASAINILDMKNLKKQTNKQTSVGITKTNDPKRRLRENVFDIIFEVIEHGGK